MEDMEVILQEELEEMLMLMHSPAEVVGHKQQVELEVVEAQEDPIRFTVLMEIFSPVELGIMKMDQEGAVDITVEVVLFMAVRVVAAQIFFLKETRIGR